MALPLGTGQRFSALKSSLASRQGVRNPGALAAYIGRKKYGGAKMAALSRHGEMGQQALAQLMASQIGAMAAKSGGSAPAGIPSQPAAGVPAPGPGMVQ